jgi:hypothetical protein
MQLDNTKNEMETNNGNTGGQKQRENTIQKLIENMIMESNYEHSKLNKDEKNQIIKSLESIDINKDWHSK